MASSFRFLFLPVAGALTACTAAHVDAPPAVERKPAPVPLEASASAAPACARQTAGALPAATPGAPSGPIALVSAGNRRFAYLADDEDRALVVIDLESGGEIGRTALESTPSDVLVLGDGRVAVSLRDGGAVDVLEPVADSASPFSRRCAVPVPTEPLGLALSDGEILVASRWGHALTALDEGTLERRFSIDLPRDPRAIAVSADGATAFVSHVTGGRISAVDLRGGEPEVIDIAVELEALGPRFRGMMSPAAPGPMPADVVRHRRQGGQGYALVRGADGRIFAPHTLVESRSPTSGGGYGGSNEDHPPVVADVGVIDRHGRLLAAHFGPLTTSDCVLPRAAAVDSKRSRLLVACRGLDSVLAFDAGAAHPHDREVGRVKVGGGVDALAVDSAAGVAYAWSAFDRTLATISTEIEGKKNVPERTIVIPRRSTAPSEEIARGRGLFFATNGLRVAADGRSCASCHPDGRDDGMTWATPEGPRQTPMLAARLADTSPFGWDGARTTLLTHLDRTLERLHGTGLDRSERADIVAYVSSMTVPSERAPTNASLERGKEIFESDQAGCSGCHAGAATTDGLAHDVKSRAGLDQHVKFDTPSLRFVGKTAPFFHDGRFATMRELLVASDGKMGHTAHLKLEDLEALAAYVESL